MGHKTNKFKIEKDSNYMMYILWIKLGINTKKEI